MAQYQLIRPPRERAPSRPAAPPRGRRRRRRSILPIEQRGPQSPEPLHRACLAFRIALDALLQVEREDDDESYTLDRFDIDGCAFLAQQALCLIESSIIPPSARIRAAFDCACPPVHALAAFILANQPDTQSRR